jgi:hypothetical protein
MAVNRRWERRELLLALKEVLALLQALNLELLLFGLRFGLEEVDANLLDNFVKHAGHVRSTKGGGDGCYNDGDDENGGNHICCEAIGLSDSLQRCCAAVPGSI